MVKPVFGIDVRYKDEHRVGTVLRYQDDTLLHTKVRDDAFYSYYKIDRICRVCKCSTRDLNIMICKPCRELEELYKAEGYKIGEITWR